MSNFTKVDLDCMITLSAFGFPYEEIENGFVLHGCVLGDDKASGFSVFVQLLQEGENQRLELKGTSSHCISKEYWNKAFELCNEWSRMYNYVATWFSEEEGKFYIGTSIENPDDLPKGWLIESFMKPYKEISYRFWPMVWKTFGGLEAYAKRKAGKGMSAASTTTDNIENIDSSVADITQSDDVTSDDNGRSISLKHIILFLVFILVLIGLARFIFKF